MKVGDSVIDPDGGLARVEGVYPQGKLDVFEVTTSDGASVKCSADHLWAGLGYGDKLRVMTAIEVASRLAQGKSFYLPPIRFRDSLGWRETITWREGKARSIESIVPAGSTECTCIKVSSKRSLFVTDRYIVTHNTTDVAWTFRKAAWLQTEPGGLIPVARAIGYTPPLVITLFDDVNPRAELMRARDQAVELVKEKKVTSIVLDTGSEIADRMVQAASKRYTNKMQVYGEIYVEFNDIIRTFVALTETYGLWFICICHDIGPVVDEKTRQRLRGGPLLPGTKLPRAIPPKFDMVLRAAVHDDLTERRRVYLCDPMDPDYIMKDRFGVAGDIQPMELKPLIFKILHPNDPVPEEARTKQLNQNLAS